ncbi:DUF421 domain-containing protein [Ferruginibacter albus]|uniref:DUF421 domain-containing protein n=1 Tax=Ferruginibacter albus TaxID=2875540 RepID=UPI001CC77C0F|nr:YetF domain-containing protein [Ferruginibacter albus]UAY51366.1 DUF421 domain-containing protein [Ferruginibacter albus]
MHSLFNSNYVDVVVRSILVYLFIVVAIRIFGKKELAQLSVIDLVFILLISNAVQNAMVGQDSSLSGGLLAAGALFITNFILKRILYKSQRLNQLLEGKPVLLIYKGEIQIDHLHHLQISVEELEAAVREHGVEDVKKVDIATLEADGNISVISNDFKNVSTKPMAIIAHRRKHKLRGRIAQN